MFIEFDDKLFNVNYVKIIEFSPAGETGVELRVSVEGEGATYKGVISTEYWEQIRRALLAENSKQDS